MLWEILGGHPRPRDLETCGRAEEEEGGLILALFVIRLSLTDFQEGRPAQRRQ